MVLFKWLAKLRKFVMYMKRIKILFVISSLTGGGAEYVARKNIEIVSKQGEFEVSVITADKEWNYDNVSKFIAYDFSKEQSIVNRSLGSLYLLKNKKAMRKCINNIQPDIIHIHNYIMFTPSLLHEIRRYKAKFNCSIIMTHHTYNYLCTNDSLYNYKEKTVCDKCIGKYNRKIIKNCCSGNYITSVAKYLQKKLFRTTYKQLVDKHIAPSEFMKSQLLRLDKHMDVEVVYNPCIENVMPVNLKKKYNKIVYFGRVNREKNIVGFTKLFCELNKDFEFVIIGNGNDEGEIKKIIEENSGCNITFINKFLNTENLYKVIQDAKFLVLPSVWYENSPVSIIEGINLSIIPIVNNIGGMKELIDMFDIGYSIDMTRQDAVINLFDEIKEMDHLYDEIKLEKTRGVLGLFTSKKYAEIISDVYLNQYKKNAKGD